VSDEGDIIAGKLTVTTNESAAIPAGSEPPALDTPSLQDPMDKPAPSPGTTTPGSDPSGGSTLVTAISSTPAVTTATPVDSPPQPTQSAPTSPPVVTPRSRKFPLFHKIGGGGESSRSRHRQSQPPEPPPEDPVAAEAYAEVLAEDMTPEDQTMPSYATRSATRVLQKQLRDIIKLQLRTKCPEDRFWTLDLGRLDNLYIWYFTLTSFDASLPIAQDMRKFRIREIRLQVLFGPQHPLTPPFVRVISPRFLRWMHQGGGHITVGSPQYRPQSLTSRWESLSRIIDYDGLG